MHSSFDAVPIAIRIVLAGLVGCIGGFVFLIAYGFASLANAIAHTPEWSLTDARNFVFASAFYISIAFMTFLPFISAAVATGICFRHRIARHPFAWSMFAAAATWIITSAVQEFTGTPNAWARAHSAAERFQYALLSSDGMLILSGSLSAGVSFYLLGLAHQRAMRRA